MFHVCFKIPVQLVLLFIVISCTPTEKEYKGDLIISNVNIIDVRKGGIIQAMDVIINGDTITQIVKHGGTFTHNSKVIDGTDKYLIPGLWDMHAHDWFAYKEFTPMLLANGVTGVREMFGELDRVKEIKDSLATGKLDGPRIISSGQIIDGSPAAWQGSVEVTSGEQGRVLVRKQLAEGADFIKVYSLLNKDVYQSIAGECKKLNVSMSGHIPIKVKLEEAISSGHQSAEHFFGILEYCSSKRDSFYTSLQNEKFKGFEMDKFTSRLKFITDTFDSSRVKPLVELLQNNNMWMTPTSVVNRSAAFLNDSTFTNDKRIIYMPAFITEMWTRSKRSKEDFDVERKWYKLGLSIMKRMVNGNVKFLAGTDFGNPYVFPGFSLHDELEIYVRDAGFTPLQSLQTATINPAIFLRSRGGVVEEGKSADLVLLSANPLDEITNTKLVDGIVLRGVYHDGTILKKNLEALAKRDTSNEAVGK
ncbi:MAG: amidohydrolase family protein [Chryseolinea sp.]